MTKTFAIVIAIASLATALPAQAATRSVDIHAGLFSDRCIAQGGAFAGTDGTYTCETAETAIVCSFPSINSAECEWPGIDGQVAVNRIIGMQDAHAVEGGDGGAPAKKGGGFKNDLPIKWK